MRATNLEFRFRLFAFTLIYLVGFALRSREYHQTFAEWVATALAGHPSRLRMQVCVAVGGLIIAVAAALRTWATAYLQGEVVHDMAMHSDRLVADGPYRYVRNPLYLGTALLAAGIGFLAPLPNWLFLVIATLLFNLRLILREEAGLLAEHSQSFRVFKAAVPRLLPSLTPRLPASGRQPQWRQAWMAESFMWAYSLAMLIFALTLNTFWLNVMLFGTLAAYAILHVINSQRQKQSAAAPV